MKSTSNIKLASSEQCTGCSACVNVCPQSCVTMDVNILGAIHPRIDTNHCIKCGLCIKTCPSLVTFEKNYDVSPISYTIQSKDDDVLLNSSSGGAFFEIARYVINEGGVVFGVCFNGVHVQHDWTDTLEGVKSFMGSKYVQSDIGLTYVKVREFLKEGRVVLFSGTPCQVVGLRKYLNDSYNKLITIDLICHGVTNPIVWENYIISLKNKLKIDDFISIKFRAKFDDYSQGCNYYTFYVKYKHGETVNLYLEPRQENLYYSYFSRNYYRESCYYCKYRSVESSVADFTIGDSVMCGQSPDNKKMVSTMVVHSTNGRNVLNAIQNNINIFPLDLIRLHEYYYQARIDEDIQKKNRPWRLVNLLSKYVPLKFIRPLYMHDTVNVIVERKILKYAKKIQNRILFRCV